MPTRNARHPRISSPPHLVRPGELPAAALRCLVLLLAAMHAIMAFSLVSQPSLAAGFATPAKRAFLMDLETGAILYQKNADELAPPASMSKLMTLEVVFDALKKGKVKLDDEFLMSEDAWRRGGAPSRTSAMFVPVNTSEPLEELLKGIIVQSGNDAAIAIAQGMAGSESAFAKLMQKRAREIGLTQSTFRNATGLYHPQHLMTARELTMLARHIIETYPEYYAWFAEKRFKYRRHNFINRNPLLFMDVGADGLKTGYIKQSGYGVTMSAVQDGRRLIGVISGFDKSSTRKSEAARLLNWGFRSFAPYKVFNAGEVVGQARVWGGTSFYVPLEGRGQLRALLPIHEDKKNLSVEIVYQGPVKAPIAKGDRIATLRVTTTSNAVNELPLYAAESVPEGSIVRQGIDSFAIQTMRWIGDQASGLISGIL